MTEEQIEEAITQAKGFLSDLEEARKAGTGNYDMFSMRSVLSKLGYHGEDADDVIRKVAKRGFNYCLDPLIPSKGPEGEKERPSMQVCYFGQDQLLSRLQCLR